MFFVGKELSKCARDRLIWTDPWVFIACGFGVGALPFMPGTYGTVVGVGLYWLIHSLPLWLFSLVLVAACLAGVLLCGRANKAFGTDDHPAAVWDEIAAFGWVMWGVPFNPILIVIGFVLFRFFDIVKFGPVRWLDRNLHGGWGVMLDDIVAAIFSCIVLHLICWAWGIPTIFTAAR